MRAGTAILPSRERAGTHFSSLENGADVAGADGLVRKVKRAVLVHLASSPKKGAQRDATERTADAHSPNSKRRKLRKTQTNALQPHQDIHRAIHRTGHSGDVVLAGQTRCIKDIGAG